MRIVLKISGEYSGSCLSGQKDCQLGQNAGGESDTEKVNRVAFLSMYNVLKSNKVELDECFRHNVDFQLEDILERREELDEYFYGC